jgi:preprotein translocase subunit SecD
MYKVSSISTIEKHTSFYSSNFINPPFGLSFSNSDIQKTKAWNRNIEIHFNRNGAKKWAELTKNNIGKQIAIVIDNQIYNMPEINNAINGGVAQITGLKDESFAISISESLNASVPE